MNQSFNLSFVTICRAILVLTIFLLPNCSSPEEKAQNYYEQGMKYLAQKDYTKAGIEFKNALQLKKNLVGAWRGLLQIEMHNRNFKAAVPVLREIVGLDPKDIDSRLKLGHYLMTGGALDQALNQADAAVALDDRNPNSLAFKAALQLKLNDVDGAKREAQKALNIDPTNAEARIVLAFEALQRGDTTGALSALEPPGVHFKADDELALELMKLRIFEKSGDIKQQETLLRKIIHTHPHVSAFQKSLINLYVKQKRYDDAEKELRSLSAANPTDINIGLNLVRFLLQYRGPEAARAELIARIKAGGQVFKYQIALAEFDFTHGKVGDSIRLLESLASNARSSDDALAAQVKLAQFQLQRKNFDAAEKLASSILQKDSRNVDALKIRAWFLMRRGKNDAAIVDLRQALADKPRASDLMVLLGQAYERNGSMDLADNEYAEATKVSNYNVLVTLNYSAFLRRRGGLERAEDLLTELARRQPNNVVVLSNLAEVRLARQNWSGAQEIADVIKKLGKTPHLSDEIRALSLSGQGKYGESVKILEGVQAATPAAVQPMVVLVNTLVRAKKLDQAVSFLQKVLKTNPRNAQALVLLGSIQLQKNSPKEALENFKAAIEGQPKATVGYQALAHFYIREKKFDEARTVVDQGLKQHPDSFPLHLALAGILQLKGDYEGAIAEYEIMLKQDSGSLIVANNLASLISDHHTDKASIERAHSIANILRKSEIPAFKDTLGWIDYLRGDYDSATKLLEQAAAALPNSANVQYHLGMTYIAAGQVAKASEQFKKASALRPNSSLQQKITAAQRKTGL